MEMPGRRSNYSLLSQHPDDQYSVSMSGAPPLYYDSLSSEGTSNKNSKVKLDRGLIDWDQNQSQNQSQNQQQAGRIGGGGGGGGNTYASSIGLQRESSGSSFGESSLSGDYYVPTISTTAANEIDAFVYGHDESFRHGDLRTKVWGSSSGKSWAQQTEESYQLQLALALRLSSEATCADDPNFLDPVPDDTAVRTTSSSSVETVSHRFWVNGCLSYFDKVPDGFYLIHGVNPYVWTVCTDLHEHGRIPSIESLRSVDPVVGSLLEVILVDRRSDPGLKELQNRVHNISCSCRTTKEVVDRLAKLVCGRMGGSSTTGEDDLVSYWRECSDDLKDCLGSVVVPIGSLSVGLCRHRALLFKVLADAIDLPCRIAKGCKYCKRDDAASCLVRFGLDREYLVDLIENPGYLCEPDSLLNGPSSITISSPLRFPRLKAAVTAIDFRSLAKQYFSDCESLNLVFDDAPAGTTTDEENPGFSLYPKKLGKIGTDRNNLVEISSKQLPLPPNIARPTDHDRDSHYSESITLSKNIIKKRISKLGHRDLPVLVLSDPMGDATKDSRFAEGSQLVPSKRSKELFLEVDDLDIPWSDLVLREKIGAGSFGTVHRAEWNGSDVAVKILMEQDLHAERFKEFLSEVAIMKCLRHPNIVLFMGAVTQPPNLSIVTEYLSRGSLYKLLHKPGVREVLDERRQLSMAYDVAKGMNYLHRRNPPIVHRDLKSPNLLVDKKYTVKVCDFGLSRLKANTFLSSKTAAGTPEWMAPEVLRDEPSNEKSDVYSFGVILWELATLQQPWGNLNPPQTILHCFQVGWNYNQMATKIFLEGNKPIL
ncbi:serine/threonine-protein kinase CTR1-like isoform X2 [Durio zibethinus]|uniref:non-specific serine/threonine protein kinase n=1 Tax=Durio zibethinus TaxID=66656 RepID=A0A6P5YRZ0_DURZI|nr:serine/threonine-protein kinase CTR1-like isoform X2 [Durio zibethinus]XP_022743314.1 serine/threonine-protein kinase CTR1-like isoform X2 [Durio zibethinus]XP_022743315.1 serine/threonine-protein kinase CTR1-like isoform X2 [Durio zibethinus]